MKPTFDLVVKGGTVVNHDGEGVRDIAVSDGRFVDVGRFSDEQAAETIDCSGLHVLPGMIDTQVHLREPGGEHKEDLETGGRAAVMGGVTAVFEMPNTDPPTVTAEAHADKVARARHRMACDFAFFIGGTRENAEELPELERLPGCPGVKVFMGSSTGSLLVEDDDGVERVLANASRRVAFHSEDEFRLDERRNLRTDGDPSSHPVWRDETAAIRCTERLLRIARETRARIHVLHISTAEEMPLLGANKDIATVEATPQHLSLSAPEAYERLGNLAQMNPPLRDARHTDGIWWGVRSGVVDVLGSDHAPHTLEEKSRPYPASPSGMPGVQTLAPVMLNHVNAGRLSLQRLVDLTSHGPSRVFQIARKGRIAAGCDADLTIVDMKARRTIRNDWIESRCGWTPFDGLEVTGWVRGTVIRGRRVMWDGDIVAPSGGEALEFCETAAGK